MIIKWFLPTCDTALVDHEKLFLATIFKTYMEFIVTLWQPHSWPWKNTTLLKRLLKHPCIALWVERSSSRHLKTIEVHGVLGNHENPIMKFLATIKYDARFSGNHEKIMHEHFSWLLWNHTRILDTLVEMTEQKQPRNVGYARFPT